MRIFVVALLVVSSLVCVTASEVTADSVLFPTAVLVIEAEGFAPRNSWTGVFLEVTPSAIKADTYGPGANGGVSLTAAAGTNLTTGVYFDTSNNASSTGPGIALTVNGGICNTETGTFIIDELEFQPDGQLSRLAARWEAHCNGGNSATFGRLTFNPTVPYPDREISPSWINFNVDGGEPETVRPITIRNNGPAPLHVTAVTLGGEEPGQFMVDSNQCVGAAIAAGQTCTVQVSFRPTVQRHTSRAWLTIVDEVSSLSGYGTGRDIILEGRSGYSNGEFTAVTPARVLDTRTGIGAPRGPLTPNVATNVQITGRGGVPASGVSAVVLNVTAVGATVDSFVTLWATNGQRPWVSNLNPTPGRVVANMATVPIGGDGKIAMYNALGSVDLLFDVVGYYSSDSNPGSRYHAVNPVRMIDTRLGIGGVPVAKVGTGQTLSYNVLQALPNNPAYHVTGIIMNVTAVGPTATSFLTVHPGDSPRPNTSNLNYIADNTVPNLVTVRVPASGIIAFYNDTGATDVLVDVVGYYSDDRLGDVGRFFPVTPARAFDTRYDAPIPEDDLYIFEIAGYDGIPAWASAAVMNITAVTPSTGGFLSVFPDDLCTLPIVSNLNFSAGQTIPNMVIGRLSQMKDCAVIPGGIDIYNAVGQTHVIVDVAGYFL